MHRLLLVEDDEALRTTLRDYFDLKGYAVVEAGCGHDFRLVLADQQPDLILLDLNLPDADGVKLLRELRKTSQAPLVVVSGRSDEATRLKALDAGADDYVIKPFNIRELELRVRNFLQRQLGRNQLAQEQWRFGPWLLDARRRILSAQGGPPLSTTRGEFELLLCLVRAGGQVVARDRILALLEQGNASITPESLPVLISRLRRKLSPGAEQHIIATAPGIGYQLNLPVEPVNSQTDATHGAG